ncbi:hypothetical protein V8F06_005643 [Rhypophila decipiens]
MPHQRRPSWRRKFLRHQQQCGLPQPRTFLYLAILTVISLCLLLPYDNTLRLATRWGIQSLQSVFLPRRPSERWIYDNPPAHPVKFGSETLVIVKTGYGTRHRVDSWFEALSPGGKGTAEPLNTFLLIADFASNDTSHIYYQDQVLPIHDVVQTTVSHHHVVLDHKSSHARVQKYRQLQRAISSGDDELALELARTSGWELDALKFISGLELAYHIYPAKKWYILTDDDTYLVQSSLRPLLSHLDSSKPYYVGNGVGDFRTRFAHGGSSVILSQAAMRKLVVENPQKRTKAYIESLDETWGDRLLARALLRVGVYLDEKYSHFFTGESPRQSRIRAERICSPVVAFHGLATSEKMLDAGRHLGDENVTGPVLWADLRNLYSQSLDLDHTQGRAISNGGGIHRDWDHIFHHKDTDVAIIENVAAAEICAGMCVGKTGKFKNSCLAWTWEPAGTKGKPTGTCFLSDWMVVGEKSKGRISGVHESRLRELERVCLGY